MRRSRHNHKKLPKVCRPRRQTLGSRFFIVTYVLFYGFVIGPVRASNPTCKELLLSCNKISDQKQR